MKLISLPLVPLAVLTLFLLPSISATCNIDSAGTKTYSTSDGLVITRSSNIATFRLGCSQGTNPPKLHAEVDGKYLVVTSSSKNSEFKEVSFVEDLDQSKSRWIEIQVYDDDTYQKLLKARESGSNLSYYKPMKTISISHYGVSKGPYLKSETVFSIGMACLLVYAQHLRSKIIQ